MYWMIPPEFFTDEEISNGMEIAQNLSFTWHISKITVKH